MRMDPSSKMRRPPRPGRARRAAGGERLAEMQMTGEKSEVVWRAAAADPLDSPPIASMDPT